MTKEEARARLEEFRVSIDAVDRRLVDLLNERTRVVEDDHPSLRRQLS